MYDDKKILFSDKELKDLKKSSQIYDISNMDNIKNITVSVTDDLAKTNYDFSDDNKIIQDSNLEYVNILNNIEKDITNINSLTCDDVSVLNNPRYLKNYYLDIFGNNIESNLSDYFANYKTTINKKEQPFSECVPVKINKGNSNMIIPDQFNTNKYITNAYNIDWSRIINPYTIY